MAYDPLTFLNNNTTVGVASSINAPGGEGSWVVIGDVASFYPPSGGGGDIIIIENGTPYSTGTIDLGTNLSGTDAGGIFTLNAAAGSTGVNIAGTVYPSLAAGTNVTLTGNGSTGTISASGGSGSSGITGLLQGALTATGVATIGSGLSLTGTTNPTLSNSGVVAFGGVTGSIILGPSLSMTGQTLNVSGIGTIHAQEGSVSTAISTLNAGANITFSGTSPQLTISTSSTASSNLTIQNQGTSIGVVGTINAGSGITASVAGGVATITSSAAGSGAVSLVSAQTVSGAAEVDFFMQPGYGYFIQAEEVVLSNAQLYAQFGTGTSTSPAWNTSNYAWICNAGFGSGGSGNPNAEMYIQPNDDNGASFDLRIYGAIGTASDKHYIEGFYGGNQIRFSGQELTGTAVTSLRIVPGSGTITGNFYLYSVVR